MRVLGVIAARGGSKGLPNKHVRALCGKPLLAYTAEAALEAHRLDRVILSTDAPAIAAVGRRCGLDVPFMRPPELADDRTPTLPVIQHAIRWLEIRGDHYDAVCQLQPTCPLRRPGTIDRCVELLERSRADCVMSIVRVPPRHNPHWVYFMAEDGSLHRSTGAPSPISRRQDLPAAFHPDGAVYVTWRAVVMDHNCLFGERMHGICVDEAESVDIDTPEDWERAEAIMRRTPDGRALQLQRRRRSARG